MAACLNSAFASDPLAFDSDVIVIQTCHLGGRLEVAAIVDPDSNPAERPPLDPHATHREGPHRSSSGHARRCWPSAALRWRQRGRGRARGPAEELLALALALAFALARLKPLAALAAGLGRARGKLTLPRAR